MMVRSDASLRGKAKAIAREHGLSAQEVMQRFFFEHFLMRLERTRYRDNFIIKGGLLLSSMMGVTQRTTMDMDTTLKSMPLDEATLSATVREICSVEVRDDILYMLERVEPIREDDEYGGLRAHLIATYGRMRNPMKIDVTTGDVITPGEIDYEFPALFDGMVIHVMAYPLETSIAEKFESIVKRGAATTRARDLYDIATLSKKYAGSIDWSVLRKAVERTAARRGSTESIADYERASYEIESSSEIAHIWKAYVRLNPYASSTTVKDAMTCVREIGKKLSL